MATTHDATVAATCPQFAGTNAAWGTSGNGFGQPTVLKFHFDMLEIATQLAATIDGSASDLIKFWDIPAHTFIHTAYIYVTTAESSAATVAIADEDANTLISATAIGTAATAHGTDASDTVGALGGFWYPATKYLKATFATFADIDQAVFDVYVVCTLLDPA